MRLFTPETGAAFSMKYGKLISMRPSSASSRTTISFSMTWKLSTVSSRSCALRISTKRDMCVPLNWCGRPTYMLKLAMVCCTRPERSLIWIGWRIALTPTLSMASLRESGVAWTSGMFCRSRAFMLSFYHPTKLLGHYVRNRLLDASGVQPDRCKQPAGIAVVDEAVRKSQKQNAFFAAGQRLAHRGAGTAHHLVLFDGHQQLMAV